MATTCSMPLPRFSHRHGNLKGSAVVGTLMTNLALELALARQGIGLKRTAVGDKYVLEEMLRSGISLGGEPSGHIIFADLSLAGDGMITLLEVLRLLAETGQPFGELLRGYRPFPQLIRNVRVREEASVGIDSERRESHRRMLPRIGRARPRGGALLRHRTPGARDGGRCRRRKPWKTTPRALRRPSNWL